MKILRKAISRKPHRLQELLQQDFSRMNSKGWLHLFCCARHNVRRSLSGSRFSKDSADHGTALAVPVEIEFVHLSKGAEGVRVPVGQPKKMMREKPPQRDAAEVFPRARFSRNDKMVRAKRAKRAKFPCRNIFLCPGDFWRCPGGGCTSREMAKKYVLTY
jgi:hypothetical protein